ncbi:MAG: VOC family protein [Bacteroidales bacterium]|nr:VOC family protein [Bacteroidales bacterium]
MKKLISFFEIPASDFDRAVEFYEHVLDVTCTRCDCGEEKMAFFPDPETGPRGAISYAKGFDPSPGGVIISFCVDRIEDVLSRVIANGGKVFIPKTKIEAEGQGYFAVFFDCEGNKIGLHSVTE